MAQQGGNNATDSSTQWMPQRRLPTSGGGGGGSHALHAVACWHTGVSSRCAAQQPAHKFEENVCESVNQSAAAVAAAVRLLSVGWVGSRYLPAVSWLFPPPRAAGGGARQPRPLLCSCDPHGHELEMRGPPQCSVALVEARHVGGTRPEWMGWGGGCALNARQWWCQLKAVVVPVAATN